MATTGPGDVATPLYGIGGVTGGNLRQVYIKSRVVYKDSATTQLDNSLLERPWLQKQQGFLAIAADHVELQTNEIENAVTIIGNIDLSLCIPFSSYSLRSLEIKF